MLLVSSGIRRVVALHGTKCLLVVRVGDWMGTGKSISQVVCALHWHTTGGRGGRYMQEHADGVPGVCVCVCVCVCMCVWGSAIL